MGKHKGKKKKSDRSIREANKLRIRLKRQDPEFRAKELERTKQYAREKSANDPEYKARCREYNAKWKKKKQTEKTNEIYKELIAVREERKKKKKIKEEAQAEQNLKIISVESI